nr:MAG TPA: hypothetical protein [Caudoviricetes sp.]
MESKVLNNGLREEVLNIITERSKEGKWTSQKFIINSLDVRISDRTLRAIIQTIRADDNTDIVILTDYNKGYKLMSEEDNLRELAKRKISILKSLKLYYKDVKRFNAHNNYKLKLEENEIELMKTLIKEMR